MNKILITFGLALSLIFSQAFAGSSKPIKVGTGGMEGNYYGMMQDINDYCADMLDRSLDIQETKGSIQNLSGMTNKKFALIWVQEDVLKYYARQTPSKVNDNRMKIVTGGHEEALQLLIPKGYKPESSGSSWSKVSSMFSSDTPKALDLTLLKGQVIGSYGGSMTSTKALSLFLGLNLNVVEIPKDRIGQAGDVPILLVGGVPYAPIEAYLATGKYNLVPIDARQLQDKAPFYNDTTINYEVAGELVSVKTAGVRALLVGKSYRKASKNENMINLASCISDNLEDIADDGDTNANWWSVLDLEEAGQTNWSYFELK